MSWMDLIKGKTGAGNTCTIRRLLLGAGTQVRIFSKALRVGPEMFLRSEN